MKKYFILSVLLLVSGFFASCNYLNIDDYFEDTFQEDSIYANKRNIERYFNGAAALLPVVDKIWEYGNTPGVTGSDEAVSCGDWNGMVVIQFSGTKLMNNEITSSSMGGWTWDFNIWPKCYKVIRKVNTILPHIDGVRDMNSFERMEFRAKCRFLRAYAYYLILQQNGPMILLGDEIVSNNEEAEYYARTRNTYDECVDYICSEFDEAAKNLPDATTSMDQYIPTEGAALALAARVRLQAASPLYNGGEAARRFFGDFTRCTDGDHYVSQSYDERKWALAAAAAKKVIDLGRYQLYTVAASTDAEHPESGNYGTYVVTLPQEVPTAEFPNGVGMGDKKVVDPYRSYAEMFNGELAINQNPEFIWCSSTAQVGSHMGYVFPLNFGGSSCLCVPQHIVDQFYMADGRDIKNSSSAYPYISRPYDKTCVTTEGKVLSEGYKISQGTYLAYTNREPRFYVNIGYSHAWWAMGSTTESAKKNVNIDYWNGANSGKNHSNNNVYNITGYTSRKYINPQDAMSGSGARQKDKSFPIIRYAEILLAYAEALNNLTQAYEIDGQTYTRDTEAIKYYFNQIRYRAGIPGLTADDLITVEAFNKVVQRERLIELFGEGQRYYDIRRWGIVEDLEREPLMGLNVEQAEWEGFYQPTVIQYKSIIERDFKPKMVWLPLHLDEIRKVSVLDQNPGWDK